MKTVELNGVIGFDATYKDFSTQLNDAKGDDVTIVFNTPGGDVSQGFAMIAAMKSYKKAYPNAKITTEARGMLASMGPVVFSSSVVDNRRVEDNVAGMIHNPYMLAVGDSRVMKATAAKLDAYTENYASSLAACNTKKTKAEIRTMMDANQGDGTWMFGKALVDNGFADEVIPAGDGAENEANAFALARVEFDRARDMVREKGETDSRAVAVADAYIGFTPSACAGVEIADPQGSNEGDKGMAEYKTVAEFQTGSPILAKEFRDSVLAEERKRVEGLDAIVEKHGAKVGAVAELASAAKKDGRRAEDIALEVVGLVTAAMESAPAINTGANGTASGEKKPEPVAEYTGPRFR